MAPDLEVVSTYTFTGALSHEKLFTSALEDLRKRYGQALGVEIIYRANPDGNALKGIVDIYTPHRILRFLQPMVERCLLSVDNPVYISSTQSGVRYHLTTVPVKRYSGALIISKK